MLADMWLRHAGRLLDCGAAERYPPARNNVSRRIAFAILVSFALATATHTDWHFARPTTHHLSLGLSWHWLLAIPVFALAAWYVEAAWPRQLLRASLWIVGSAIVVAGALEPAWEYLVGGATFDWAFGPVRNKALATFVGTGLLSYVAVLALRARRRQARLPD